MMIYQIILTEKCNLNCEYCFEGHKGSRKMDEAVIPDLIAFFKHYQQEKFIVNPGNTVINFNGGEALLEFELLKTMFYRFKAEGISRFNVSTNLTLADDRMLDFFFTNGFALHASIDGKGSTHDRYRKYYNGKGSFRDVFMNVKRIRDKYPSWQISHSMVFTPDTVSDLFNNVQFLVDMGIRNITACFCGDYQWDEKSNAEFEKQISLLSELFKTLYDNQEKIYFSLLSTSIANSIRNSKPDCGVCKDQVAILPGGDLLPCSIFVGMENYRDYVIGSIYRELDYRRIEYFTGDNVDLAECAECQLLPRCHNKCYGANKRTAGNLYNIPDSFCAINQACLLEADKLISYFYETKNRQFMEEYIEPLKKQQAPAAC